MKRSRYLASVKVSETETRTRETQAWNRGMIPGLTERLLVAYRQDDESVTVALRPDWRGMNAHTLGVWRMPLNERDRARCEELGIPADMVTEAARKPWARIGGVTI
jgi:hypothetical protein